MKIYEPHFEGGLRKEALYQTRPCEDKTSGKSYQNYNRKPEKKKKL